MIPTSSRWSRGARSILVSALGVLAGTTAFAQTLKLATLAPQGSVWDAAMRSMGDRWAKETGGRVQLRVYAGGVAGDESDVLRKTRVGQFQGAAITVAGLAAIDPAFNVFQIPMLFASFDELHFVLAKMRPALEQRLAAKGFVLLHWGHGGWIHLFSRAPIRTLEDLKRQKLFVWAGDDAIVQQWRRGGYDPVPLAATDVLLGLQTKMIDVVPTTPIAALSLQWYRQAPNMLGLGLAPLTGGVILTASSWEKIAEADRVKLRAVAAAVERDLERDVPTQDREAIEQMRQRGLNLIEISAEESKPWRAEAERFARTARETTVPPDILQAAEAAIAEFRAAGGTQR